LFFDEKKKIQKIQKKPKKILFVFFVFFQINSKNQFQILNQIEIEFYIFKNQ